MMMDECMSNLTSASNVTSGNRDQQSQPPKRKRKRNQAGAEAEVIAMSPKSLLATNRFVCEVCNKGFQRDQNLQLHRRGHNLPWKLKQRKRNEVIRRKVYVCPEVTCVHHEASRALGDLTGIKKHFCRKHCEKKWKCDKCSKRYAVLSDWKAHSKICGTRQYKCDCGTLFSRRDSFITHRAFCDALAEERERSININSSSQQSHIQLNLQNQFHGSHSLPSLFPLKQEQDLQETFNISSNFFSSRLDQESMMQHQNSSNPTNNTLLISSFQPTKMSSPHMSATSLLQKATQMGVTMSKPVESIIRPHQLHMFTPTSGPSSFSESTNLGSTHIAFTESDTYSRGRPDTSQLFRRSSIPTFSEGSTQVALAESDSYLRGRFGTAELFRRSIIPRFGEGSTQGAPTRGIADTSEFIQRSSIPTLGETNNIAFAGSDSYSGGMFGTPELFQRGQSSTYLDTSIAGSSVGNFSAREEMGDGFIDGLASFGNKPVIKYSSCMGQVDPTGEASSSSLLHEMISSSFEEPLIFNGGQNFSGILSSKMNKNFQETLAKIPKEGENNEGLTRDFLGLTTAYPNSTRGQECLLMADLHHMGSSYEHQNHQN